jgi:hypothetical protein
MDQTALPFTLRYETTAPASGGRQGRSKWEGRRRKAE